MRINPETVARASSRHPWRTIGAWLLLIVAMGAVSSKFLAGVLTQDIAFTNQPESVKADAILKQKFGLGAQESDTEFFVVTSTATATDPSVEDKMQALKAAVERLGSKDVSGPVYSYVDAQLQSQALFTPDGRGVVIALQTTGDAAPVISALSDALPSAAPAGFRVQVLSPDQMPAVNDTTGSNAPSAFVVVSSTTTATDAPAFASTVKAIEGKIVKTQGSALATAPYSGIDAQQQVASLVSKDGLTTLLPVTIADTTDAIVQDLRDVADQASSDGFDVQVAGQATLEADFTTIAQEDLRKGESIGILVALVVLIVVFGSIIAALLPIVMAMFAIAVALGLVAIIGQFVHFNLFVENIVTMIGLAVGIDYSLFIVSRYREERKKGFSKLDAIGATGATANRAVFFSGMTVVLALLGMFIIPTTIFRALAGGAILVTVASLGASMSLLPAILGLLGDRINWPRLSKRARADGDHDPRGGFWDHLTNGVMAHPVIYLTVGALIMGGLASFYFQLNRGTSQNVTQLSNDIPSKQAFLVLSKKFDAGGATDPVRIVVTGSVDSSQTQTAIQTLRSEIANDARFSPQTTVTPSDDGSTILVSATFAGDPSGSGAFAAITDLRDTMVPKAFAATSGTTVLVGGNTAFFTDFLHVADQYQWIVLIFVLGLSFMLLTVVFRSIVVPIKAILMNLLSVGAAYGAVTLVFQKGVGIGFFNAIGFKFQQTPAIEAWLPLFLFSILFGLSMDYEVFLLSRIREEYDKTHDNTEAVAYGLRTTAGVITGAAIIMVVVFTGFASGRLGPLQQMGFGLAVAVLMDATIVRTLLVPASMRLLGDVNWYLPKWLEWLPKVNVEGHEPTLEVHVPDTPAELVER